MMARWDYASWIYFQNLIFVDLLEESLQERSARRLEGTYVTIFMGRE